MLGALVWYGFKDPALLTAGPEFSAFSRNFVKEQPILPMLFVTIACGIISGFHATQSPIIARTMKSEREAKSDFYGMMILEGIIGMIWAAGGLAIYNMIPETLTAPTTNVLIKITHTFLGDIVGNLTVLAVIILAVTSGDTAMRSLRLSLAETLNLDQKNLRNRFVLCLPLIAIVILLLAWSNRDQQSFNHLWNYFAWGNQVLAASTLMAATAWLTAHKKLFLPAVVPGMFMTFIVVTYIAWISPEHKGPLGFGLPLGTAYVIGVAAALVFAFLAWGRGKKLQAETPAEQLTDSL